MLGLVVLFVILAVLAVGLWYFEKRSASRPERFAGLIIPGAFLALSLFSIIQSVPKLVATMQEQGYGTGAMILTAIFAFFVTNIPTFWVYFVYYRTRKRLGMEIFPFHMSDGQTAAKKPTAPQAKSNRKKKKK